MAPLSLVIARHRSQRAMTKSALRTDNGPKSFMTFFIRAIASAATREGILIKFIAAHAHSLVLDQLNCRRQQCPFQRIEIGIRDATHHDRLYCVSGNCKTTCPSARRSRTGY